jgi:hypothetical protein
MLLRAQSKAKYKKYFHLAYCCWLCKAMQDEEVAMPALIGEKKVSSTKLSKVEKGSIEEMESMLEQSKLHYIIHINK